MEAPLPADLWDMSPNDFNQWRRENDLKRLFNCFQDCLPHFNEWLDENKLTIDYILETNNPGQFFYWDKEVYSVKLIKVDYISYFFTPIVNKRHENQIETRKIKPLENEKVERLKFKPYFLWVKQKHKLNKPIKTQYSGDLDTFRYTTGVAPDVQEMCSWSIAPGVPVLKLGGTKINGWFKLLNRNLDFTNLDFLKIEGDQSVNTGIQIFYSHCVNISAENVVANFTKFYQCEFGNLNVIKSRFYSIGFYNCDIFKAYFENSSISNLTLKNCSANSFSFNRVEVEDINYIPPKKEFYNGKISTYETVADNYKRFRMLYQSNGLRQEASDAYYLERLYEMKFVWASSEFLKAFTYLWSRNVDYGLSAINYNFKKLNGVIASFISYLIWGYGERPLRIMCTSVIVLLFYAAVYYISDISQLNNNGVNSIYLSVVTFTTLGFGDITPLGSSLYKLIVGSEALIGAFSMGLFVAGFANKSRY